MVKEIYFRETKEKAVSRKDKYDDRQEARDAAKARYTSMALARKNISKKDLDKVRREKFEKRKMKGMEDRKHKKQNDALKIVNHGRLGKLSLEEKKLHLMKE